VGGEKRAYVTPTQPSPIKGEGLQEISLAIIEATNQVEATNREVIPFQILSEDK